MAKLTTGARKDMKSSEFALPAVKDKGGKNKAGRGGYPIPNKSHAEAAVRDSKHAEDVGDISGSERKEILKKVRSKFPGIGSPGGSSKSGESRMARSSRLDGWAKGR